MSSLSYLLSGALRRARLPVLALAVVAVWLPAHALYKVVGPDGKVTYTDRAPGTSEGKVTPLTSTGSAVTASPSELPIELRQVSNRYPVTVYVVADCAPCDSARTLLRQRGVPFAERIIVTEEDAEAVQRLTGTRDVPTMTIGSQHLRGFSPETWSSYLDSAGYPRESRLPPGYEFAAAKPVTQRAEPPRPAPPAPTPAPASPTGIRF
jgi:glutaredoxin